MLPGNLKSLHTCSQVILSPYTHAGLHFRLLTHNYLLVRIPTTEVFVKCLFTEWLLLRLKFQKTNKYKDKECKMYCMYCEVIIVCGVFSCMKFEK